MVLSQIEDRLNENQITKNILKEILTATLSSILLGDITGCVATNNYADKIKTWPIEVSMDKDHRIHNNSIDFKDVKYIMASWYGGGEKLPSHYTANGEIFRPEGFTAAHRTLPFGTKLRVCYHGCVIVRVNDRGPANFTNRDLDLSRGAAKVIGLISVGSGLVYVQFLK